MLVLSVNGTKKETCRSKKLTRSSPSRKKIPLSLCKQSDINKTLMNELSPLFAAILQSRSSVIRNKINATIRQSQKKVTTITNRSKNKQSSTATLVPVKEKQIERRQRQHHGKQCTTSGRSLEPTPSKNLKNKQSSAEGVACGEHAKQRELCHGHCAAGEKRDRRRRPGRRGQRRCRPHCRRSRPRYLPAAAAPPTWPPATAPPAAGHSL